ncbi:MAG TPA: nucleotidyltransferase [Candidatus Tectomicrobia bacterium]
MASLAPISKNQKRVIKQLVLLLNEHGVEYEISGGLAAIFYGARRPLFDIDLDIHQADFSTVCELLKPYIVEEPHRTTSSHKFDIYFMSCSIDGVHVDFSQVEESYVIDESGRKHRMDSTLKDAVEFDFDGITVRVEQKESLIAYKRLLARPTDLEDMQQIAESARRA